MEAPASFPFYIFSSSHLQCLSYICLELCLGGSLSRRDWGLKKTSTLNWLEKLWEPTVLFINRLWLFPMLFWVSPPPPSPVGMHSLFGLHSHSGGNCVAACFLNSFFKSFDFFKEKNHSFNAVNYMFCKAILPVQAGISLFFYWVGTWLTMIQGECQESLHYK